MNVTSTDRSLRMPPAGEIQHREVSNWLLACGRLWRRILVCGLLCSSGCGTDQQQADQSDSDQHPASGELSTMGRDHVGNGSRDTTNRHTGDNDSSMTAVGRQVPALTIGSSETSSEPDVIAGIMSPRLYAAMDVNLAEEAMIVGVQLNGESRAYLLDAMAAKDARAVNDMIQEIPISVTYSDETKAVRVFSSPAKGEPIALSVSAVSESGMSVVVNGLIYDHGSDTIPLEDVDFVQTAWIAWKTEHPETKVFLGSLADKFVSSTDSGSAL